MSYTIPIPPPVFSLSAWISGKLSELRPLALIFVIFVSLLINVSVIRHMSSVCDSKWPTTVFLENIDTFHSAMFILTCHSGISIGYYFVWYEWNKHIISSLISDAVSRMSLTWQIGLWRLSSLYGASKINCILSEVLNHTHILWCAKIK